MLSDLMKPEDFARGIQQAFGKTPVERVSTIPQRPLVERMVEQIDKAWPPPRPGKYPSLKQNDPLVLQFFNELFGPMLSEDEATKPREFIIRESLGGGYHHAPLINWGSWKGGEYGRDCACWAAADLAWRLEYERGNVDYECYKRPSSEDIAKLCFAVGWFQIRADNHFRESYIKNKTHLWRRGRPSTWEPEGLRSSGS